MRLALLNAVRAAWILRCAAAVSRAGRQAWEVASAGELRPLLRSEHGVAVGADAPPAAPEKRSKSLEELLRKANASFLSQDPIDGEEAEKDEEEKEEEVEEQVCDPSCRTLKDCEVPWDRRCQEDFGGPEDDAAGKTVRTRGACKGCAECFTDVHDFYNGKGCVLHLANIRSYHVVFKFRLMIRKEFGDEDERIIRADDRSDDGHPQLMVMGAGEGTAVPVLRISGNEPSAIEFKNAELVAGTKKSPMDYRMELDYFSRAAEGGENGAARLTVRKGLAGEHIVQEVQLAKALPLHVGAGHIGCNCEGEQEWKGDIFDLTVEAPEGSTWASWWEKPRQTGRDEEEEVEEDEEEIEQEGAKGGENEGEKEEEKPEGLLEGLDARGDAKKDASTAVAGEAPQRRAAILLDHHHAAPPLAQHPAGAASQTPSGESLSGGAANVEATVKGKPAHDSESRKARIRRRRERSKKRRKAGLQGWKALAGASALPSGALKA